MQMQEMEWMSLDDIEYDDLEGIPVVNDPANGTPLFNPSTENLDHSGDSEEDSETED